MSAAHLHSLPTDIPTACACESRVLAALEVIAERLDAVTTRLDALTTAQHTGLLLHGHITGEIDLTPAQQQQMRKRITHGI